MKTKLNFSLGQLSGAAFQNYFRLLSWKSQVKFASTFQREYFRKESLQICQGAWAAYLVQEEFQIWALINDDNLLLFQVFRLVYRDRISELLRSHIGYMEGSYQKIEMRKCLFF